MTSKLETIYQRLLARFGPQRWWQRQAPLEVLVGTILAQNASWKNVQQAIENLREADMLDIDRLNASSDEELEELIGPAGHVRLKARRLRNVLAYIVRQHGGSLEAMFASNPQTLREALLSIKGVGPETADSIMLYAGKLPTFVVDASTHRVLARHGWIDFEADYHTIQEYFHAGLPADAQQFSEFHALLVRVGKEYCRKTPLCDTCPLCDLLPEGGPLEPQW